MAQDPQHVLRDSNGNDLGYLWFDDADGRVVIEHADSGEQVTLDENGLANIDGDAFAMDGDAQPPEEHDNAAHSSNYTSTSPDDVTSSNWGDYEIQKNGSDSSGIINFKTS